MIALRCFPLPCCISNQICTNLQHTVNKPAVVATSACTNQLMHMLCFLACFFACSFLLHLTLRPFRQRTPPPTRTA